ncbi:Oidioi.mRNA.OKI2018_I69.PAR.g12478.t1.cds [Oikopleura dioica]|uniref:Oidioi.mRNA.OKI2018_I69.PAR.g12478.t1.cds n=1 Tax=Oikopleura dioica TaxID=34765 RepID=A0ABN7S0B5_OIKDI|nr:Oidioi.mRNA.OKI2018_I69.PAR.g12478.t1.cds [Oikopleura dioica]
MDVTEQARKDVEALKAIFDQFDVNHDGRLSLKEIITCYRRFGQNPTEEEVTKRMSAFRAFDVYAKGSIKASDLAKALEFTEVDPDEAANFIQDLDIDGDGNITYDEFTKHISDSIVREALGVKSEPKAPEDME